MYSPDDITLAVGGEDNKVTLYNTENHSVLSTTDYANPVRSIAYDWKHQSFAVASGTVHCYNGPNHIQFLKDVNVRSIAYAPEFQVVHERTRTTDEKARISTQRVVCAENKPSLWIFGPEGPIGSRTSYGEPGWQVREHAPVPVSETGRFSLSALCDYLFGKGNNEMEIQSLNTHIIVCLEIRVKNYEDKLNTSDVRETNKNYTEMLNDFELMREWKPSNTGEVLLEFVQLLFKEDTRTTYINQYGETHSITLGQLPVWAPLVNIYACQDIDKKIIILNLGRLKRLAASRSKTRGPELKDDVKWLHNNDRLPRKVGRHLTTESAEEIREKRNKARNERAAARGGVSEFVHLKLKF